MSGIYVCREDDLGETVGQTNAVTLLQFNSPSRAAPEPPAGLCSVTRFCFHDISEPKDGLIAVTRSDISRLIQVAKSWDRQDSLICQCWMGVSRSTAAALIVWAAIEPGRPPEEMAVMLRQEAPFATPNPLMIVYADELLSLGGRLVTAVQNIGRGAETDFGSPFMLTSVSEP